MLRPLLFSAAIIIATILAVVVSIIIQVAMFVCIVVIKSCKKITK